MGSKKKVLVRLKVKEVAEAQGITRARLSRIADLNYQTVLGIWKDEQRDVSLVVLLKIAQALHVDIHDLYVIVPDD
jgi:DNA-binding XRE family transcriptional regulator